MGGVKSYRCDGIICLVHDDNLILCNPAIKEVRFLPSSGLLGSGYGCKGVGFEYDDCRVNDYKVIICAISFAWSLSFVSKVYSLSTNSCKEIKNTPLRDYYYPIPHRELYFKGVFYWSMDDKKSNYTNPNDTILSFACVVRNFVSSLYRISFRRRK